MTPAKRTPRHYGDMVLPPGLANLDPEIAKANEAVIEAIERKDKAAAAARTARQEAAVAPRIDREAEQAASAASKKIPPPTAPGKKQAQEEAVRELEAHERSMSSAIRHLHNVVGAKHRAYVDARRETFEGELGEMRGLVEQVLDRLTAFQVEEAAYEAAKTFPQTGALYAGADPARLPRDFEKACEKRRAAIGAAAATVPNKLPDVLAALAILLERLEQAEEPERVQLPRPEAVPA